MRLITAAVLFSAATAAAATGQVHFDGYGPVRIGMTKGEASVALHEALIDDSGADRPEDPGCDIRYAAGNPNVQFMLVSGRVARVDVVGGDVATVKGLRIGDSLAKIKKSYRTGVLTAPLEDRPKGLYATVYSHNRHGAIRFELSEGKIVTYYAGRLPEVLYVEHCS